MIDILIFNLIIIFYFFSAFYFINKIKIKLIRFFSRTSLLLINFQFFLISENFDIIILFYSFFILNSYTIILILSCIFLLRNNNVNYAYSIYYPSLYLPSHLIYLSIIIYVLFSFILLEFKVGITGISPNINFFKLVGISIFLSKIIFPSFILFLISLKKKINYFDILFFFILFSLVGILTASRANIFLLTIFLLLFHKNTNFFKILYILFLYLIFFYFITEIRSHFYIFNYEFSSIFHLFEEIKRGLIDRINNFTLHQFYISPIERFGSMDNLIRSYNYDISTIENPINIVTRRISSNFNLYPVIGNHNLEWLGYEIRAGFYEGSIAFNEILQLRKYPFALFFYFLNQLIQLILLHLLISNVNFKKLTNLIYFFLVLLFILSLGSKYYYIMIFLLLFLKIFFLLRLRIVL